MEDKYYIELKDKAIFNCGPYGLKTISSKEFVDEIRPKCSIISVDKNNKNVL